MTNPRKILIVEDDICLKTILARILSKVERNGEMTWVESVSGAKAALKKDRFSLIISDYSLTGQLTGIDLWRECERRYPGTPFLLISGMVPPVLHRLARKGRVPAFLPKPFYAEDCSVAIRNLIGSGDLETKRDS